MDKRRLEKLRQVLAERLSSGVDSASLRDQLVREMSPDEADRLLVEASEHAAAGPEDPGFRRREGVRFAGQQPGPRVTAGVFGAIGIIALLGALTRSIEGGGHDLSAYVMGLLFAVPSAVLWRSSSLVAAGCLVGLCGLALVVTIPFSVAAVSEFGLGPLGLVGFWVILLALAVRAFLVVRADRRRTVASRPVEV